jgi:hypothetical protein
MLQGQLSIAAELLKAGTDVNYQQDQETPLGTLVQLLINRVGLRCCS